MKKIIIALLVLSAIGATSCKKNNEIVPSKAPTTKVSDKGILSTWD